MVDSQRTAVNMPMSPSHDLPEDPAPHPGCRDGRRTHDPARHHGPWPLAGLSMQEVQIPGRPARLALGPLIEREGGVRELDIKDEDLPPRVRAAEERRQMRELRDRSSLGTPGAKALMKIGRWHLRVPGAEEPTAEDYRLADEELEQL